MLLTVFVYLMILVEEADFTAAGEAAWLDDPEVFGALESGLLAAEGEGV